MGLSDAQASNSKSCWTESQYTREWIRRWQYCFVKICGHKLTIWRTQIEFTGNTLAVGKQIYMKTTNKKLKPEIFK